MEKYNFVNIPEQIRAVQKKKAQELETVRKSFQVIATTEAGQEVIRYLIVQSRAFGNGLKAVSNLQKVYGVSADYFLGQSDFGKNIMQFLTPEQVAKFIQETQKEDEK